MVPRYRVLNSASLLVHVSNVAGSSRFVTQPTSRPRPWLSSIAQWSYNIEMTQLELYPDVYYIVTRVKQNLLTTALRYPD